MPVTILPGVDEYLRPGIEKLGDTISLFTETDRRTQRAIRNMLIENPSLIQQFADLEHKTPGSLKKLGFGNVSNLISGVGPSPELQEQERLGGKKLDVSEKRLNLEERQIGLEEESIGFKEIQNQMLKDLLKANPKLTEDQGKSAVAQFMGVPTEKEIEASGYELDIAKMNATRATRLQELMDKGLDKEGPMFSYVAKFRAGQDDPNETAAILADPILGQQFQLLYELQNEREARINKETGKVPTAISDLPVAIQGQFAQIAPVRDSFSHYSDKVQKFMALPSSERLAALVGAGSHQQELGELRSLQSGLMGTFRPLLSPGPLSVADMRMLENMLGNVLSTSSFVRGKEYVDGQLEGVQRFIESKIQGLTTIYPTVKVPKTPVSQIPTDMIDKMIKDGMTNQQIMNELSRRGYDVSGLTSIGVGK